MPPFSTFSTLINCNMSAKVLAQFFCVSFINIKLIDFLKWIPLEISLLACMGHPWFTQFHYLTVSKFSCNCYSLSKAKIKFYL